MLSSHVATIIKNHAFHLPLDYNYCLTSASPFNSNLSGIAVRWPAQGKPLSIVIAADVRQYEIVIVRWALNHRLYCHEYCSPSDERPYFVRLKVNAMDSEISSKTRTVKLVPLSTAPKVLLSLKREVSLTITQHRQHHPTVKVEGNFYNCLREARVEREA